MQPNSLSVLGVCDEVHLQPVMVASLRASRVADHRLHERRAQRPRPRACRMPTMRDGVHRRDRCWEHPMTLPPLWRCPSCPVILVGPQIDGAPEHTLEHESENP